MDGPRMALAGTAFLAIWNDHADRSGEYDVWHTREHVGERLGVPGFRCARRYAAGDGQLPAYFTLYGLDDLAVLESAPYRRLLAEPTPWSQSMRPGMRNFLRRACRVEASVGAGTGGLMATALLKLSGPSEDAAGYLQAGALSPALTAIHLGLIEPDVSGVSFGGREPDFAADADAVLLVEGYALKSFRPELDRLLASLETVGTGFTVYTLAFALETDERNRMSPVPVRKS